MIEKHASTFREVLGDLRPHEILAHILSAEDLFEAIGNSQILYGILLGYREENARGFELDLPDPKPFNEDSSMQNQLTLPYFMTFFPNTETERLRKLYTQEREMILAKYSKGNLLEITLNQLLSLD